MPITNPECGVCNSSRREAVDRLVKERKTVNMVRSEINRGIGIQIKRLEGMQEEIAEYKVGLDPSDDQQLLRAAGMVRERIELSDKIDAMQQAFSFTDEDLVWHIEMHSFSVNQCWEVKMEFESGTIIDSMNFSQILPNTSIADDVEGLIFKNCNLLNCKLPQDAKVERCLHIQKSFCSHLHEDLVKRGLPECTEQCWHATAVHSGFFSLLFRVPSSYKYEDKLLKESTE